MSSLKVKSISQLDAEFSVPGDKSISHRTAILAGLSNGDCVVRNFLPSEDCLNTLKAMEALGVEYEVFESMKGFGPVTLKIKGTGMKLTAPSEPIDCGNSGTGMRLLAGVLAGQDFESELFGDDSLSGRPMGRIIRPLEEMSAKIESKGAKDGCAPLRIFGKKLDAMTYKMPVASAQVKSCILLAGLFTEGRTTVIQPETTRDHTERLFKFFQLRCLTEGNSISTYGGQVPESRDILVPGDISSAAFWITAAAALKGSRLRITNVGMNETRSAILNVLVRMGAKIKDVMKDGESGEPIGSIEVQGNDLKGTEIRPAEVPNLIDEVPILAVAGALASGKTTIRNAAELRVKETDRIATVAQNLRKMGVTVEEFDDGMEITGGAELQGTTVDSYGDHRIAMAFSIAGLFAKGTTTVENVDCINTSYPGFVKQLEGIRKGLSQAKDLNPEIVEGEG